MDALRHNATETHMPYILNVSICGLGFDNVAMTTVVHSWWGSVPLIPNVAN